MNQSPPTHSLNTSSKKKRTRNEAWRKANGIPQGRGEIKRWRQLPDNRPMGPSEVRGWCEGFGAKP